MSHIELSVAMIFKNEIRCLERCLQSLQPLRERFSTELVMADTGASDGSRAVAEQYADVLFDFPWVNDFAAARNATLDRCSGDWVLVVDCDEWLDPGLDELEGILRGRLAEGKDGATVLQRNYADAGLESWHDFPALRLLRRRDGLRYEGRIHEAPQINGRALDVYRSAATVLHHDGYAALNDGSEAGKQKRERNSRLLREELKKNPEDLRRWMQLLDCCEDAPDRGALLRRAVELVDERKPGWKTYGSPILRDAVEYAAEDRLPEMPAWRRLARKRFPDSCFTRIDVERSFASYRYATGDYEGCLAPGRAYLRACAEYRGGRETPDELYVASLHSIHAVHQEETRVALADALRRLGRHEEALAHLNEVEWNVFGRDKLYASLGVATRLFAESELDMDGLIRRVWETVRAAPDAAEAQRAEEALFLALFQRFFSEQPFAGRPVWRMFLPLRGECPLGDWAAVLDAQTPEEADAALAAVEDLTALPPAVFLHALKAGADFPVPGRSLTEAQFDALAEKLAADRTFLRELAILAADAAETVPELLWARSLARAALKQR